MWDIDEDDFDSFQGDDILDFITLSLDELTMEAELFMDDGEGDNVNEEVIGLASTSSWSLTFDSSCNFVWTYDNSLLVNLIDNLWTYDLQL